MLLLNPKMEASPPCVGMGGLPPGIDPPFWKWTHQDELPTPFQGFPKKFGNKNAIISENSTGKIDPPSEILAYVVKTHPHEKNPMPTYAFFPQSY